ETTVVWLTRCSLLSPRRNDAMDNGELKTVGTGSGREIVMLVGVLALVAAGTIGTYWARSRGAEAANEPAPAATPAPGARPRTVAPTPAETEVIHADIYFDVKSTRL